MTGNINTSGWLWFKLYLSQTILVFSLESRMSYSEIADPQMTVSQIENPRCILLQKPSSWVPHISKIGIIILLGIWFFILLILGYVSVKKSFKFNYVEYYIFLSKVVKNC